MQQRRGTAAQWTAANPILAAGEIGFETDTSRFKMGNGSSTWSALQYFANSAELSALLEGAPDLLNTLGELAAAIGDDEDFIGTFTAHTSATQNVHGIADTSELVTQADLSTAISSATVDQAALAGTGIDWNSVSQRFDIDSTIATVSSVTSAINIAATDGAGALSNHNLATTNVHGIADTSLLATKAYADQAEADAVSTAAADATSKASAAQAAAVTTAGESATTALNDHNVDTTNVHGIADTSVLVIQSGLASAISLHSDDTTNVHGIADTSALATTVATASAISEAVSDHNLDTTNVHGIADTSALATKTYADGAVTTAVGALTKSSVGLGNVDNTSDADKPVSDDTQAALDLKAPLANPTFTGTVAGVTKTHVGLGNVDNTSDANKPVSTATQTALDAKASLAGANFTGNVEVDGNLVVDGDFTVNGTNFSASATSITIEDNMVQLAHQNAANTVDLGIVVAYNDGAAKHAGLVRDVSDSKWKLFQGVTSEPSTTVNFAQGSLDALAVGALEATTVTPSSGIVFSDGTQTKLGVPSVTTFATAISSSATLAAGEADKFVPLTGAVTITLPATGYVTGQSIDFYQASGTGAQFASTNSVVGTPGLKFRTTNSVVTAMKTSSGWLVFGDLSA